MDSTNSTKLRFLFTENLFQSLPKFESYSFKICYITLQFINGYHSLVKEKSHATARAVVRRRSRISARGERQGNDDLIWDGNKRFLTYANTDLQLFKMFIAI